MKAMAALRKNEDRVRLDELLVSRGLCATRSRARDAIERGAVSVDGTVVAKPGQAILPSSHITIDDPAAGYVSRAALKLIAGLDHFGLDPADSEALDIGASTGGFTQVLLKRGAAHVVAIDVGHGQLDQSLRDDPRVIVVERLNARDLSASDLCGRVPDFLVCDVSFISLMLALPPALSLAAPGAKGVFLVKPQFEAGREAIGKGGILKDPAEGPRVAEQAAPLARRFSGLARARCLRLAGCRCRRQSRIPACRGEGPVSATFEIVRLGAQGDGIAETETGPVFIPFALPGETVTAARVKDRADLIAILSASPDRVDPACRHFGTCGGCAIQHLEERAYLDWKRQKVVQALRAARIDAEVADIVRCAPQTAPPRHLLRPQDRTRRGPRLQPRTRRTRSSTSPNARFPCLKSSRRSTGCVFSQA